MKVSVSASKTLNFIILLKKLLFLLFLIMLLAPMRLEAGTYGENLRYGLKRGAKNIFTSPAEIVIGMQDYHERSGWPFVRQIWGGVIGTGKMALRLGSGVVDLGASWVPGLQQGISVKPEVLF